MKRHPILYAIIFLASSMVAVRSGAATMPNVIFILADDMGYGDAGCYGQKLIRTPNINRLAEEGMRFTQAYAGTSVCAPTRCALMTGLHMGHGAIRANKLIAPEGQQPLPAGTFTVAHMFQRKGYATGAFGKWALGFVDSPGAPDKMGFDTFFGYNCQNKAHFYYPDHLWHNHERVTLDGKTYSHDLIANQMLEWIRKHAEKPFFLYVPFTIPHYRYEVPDPNPYAGESWPDDMKKYAAMMTRMDGSIGEIMKLLKELNIDDRTLVFFSSDQGADNRDALGLFQSNGGFRGGKRTMYEGGLRVPMIARWPGHIKAGTTNETQFAFYDFLPTMAALLGESLPPGVSSDGHSVLSALIEGRTVPRDFLYWELHEWKYIQAARAGNWKIVRDGPRAPLELYDLARDPAESANLAKQHPEVVQQLAEIMKREHVPNPLWPDDLPPEPSGK